MNTQEETKEEAVAEYSDKQKALALYLNCEAEELTEGYSDDRFEYGNAEYWVMTDEEADQAMTVKRMKSSSMTLRITFIELTN